MQDGRFWLHDGGEVPPGGERYNGPEPIRLDELRPLLPPGCSAKRGWIVESDEEDWAIPTTILETDGMGRFTYLPVRPVRIDKGHATDDPEYPDPIGGYRGLLRRASRWVLVDGVRRIPELEASGNNHPMSPDSAGWLEKGETILTFIPKKPRDRTSDTSGRPGEGDPPAASRAAQPREERSGTRHFVGGREVGVETFARVARSNLEALDLTPEELLLGKVSDDGDILWSGCPRWLRKHPRTWPNIDGIIAVIVGEPWDPSAHASERDDDMPGAADAGQEGSDADA